MESSTFEKPLETAPTSHTLLPRCPRSGPCELTRIISVIICKLALMHPWSPFSNPPCTAVSHPLCPLTAPHLPSLHSWARVTCPVFQPNTNAPALPTRKSTLAFHSALPACLRPDHFLPPVIIIHLCGCLYCWILSCIFSILGSSPLQLCEAMHVVGSP